MTNAWYFDTAGIVVFAEEVLKWEVYVGHEEQFKGMATASYFLLRDARC